MNTTQPTIIDVREPSEYAAGHAEGAINAPVGTLESNPPVLANLAKDTPIIVYCRSGVRAHQSSQILTRLGFTNVTNGINQETLESDSER